MKKTFYIFFILLLPFAGIAKPKMENIWLQILNLPEKNLNLSDSLNIAIVANITAKPVNDSTLIATNSADSILLSKIAYALKAKLEESPAFTNYDFPIYTFLKNESGSTLSIGDAEQLGNDINANYIITIDMTKGITVVGTGKKTETSAIYNVQFSCYNLKAYTIDDQKTIERKFIFKEKVADEKLKTDDLIKRPAFVGACEHAGKMYADRITPHWVEEIRYYYAGSNAGMARAVQYVNNNDWANAMEVWMRYTSSEDRRQAAMACFNMALGSEVLDDYTLAVEWLQAVKKKSLEIPTKAYEEVLNRRLTEKPKMKMIYPR